MLNLMVQGKDTMVGADWRHRFLFNLQINLFNHWAMGREIYPLPRCLWIPYKTGISWANAALTEAYTSSPQVLPSPSPLKNEEILIEMRSLKETIVSVLPQSKKLKTKSQRSRWEISWLTHTYPTGISELRGNSISKQTGNVKSHLVPNGCSEQTGQCRKPSHPEADMKLKDYVSTQHRCSPVWEGWQRRNENVRK